MKNLLLTLIIALTATISTSAKEIDTLWYRTMSAGASDVDFTPDDRYVIAWTNAIEFWEVQQGIKEFSIPIDAKAVGDYNYDEQYLVFAKDSTPKLLNWQTRTVVEGFQKEKENIGRIRTAKSKNEFMANTYHEDDTFGDIINNVIYFYDIQSKRKVDSLDLGSTFEKDSFKWKRTVHEYDYAGTNDELIYVIIDDANDVIENINPMFREKQYYVNFYNRQTKELVDSVYSFTNTNEHYGGFNRMQVMNDRTKIAWNHRGGEINFYDINQKIFYDKLIFDDGKYTATEIQENKGGGFLCVTNQQSCCFYLKLFTLDTKNLVHKYDGGSWQNVSFSNNDEFLVTNIGSILVLFPSHITSTNVPPVEDIYGLIITPNPAINSINIRFQSSVQTKFKLNLIDLLGNEVDLVDEGNLNTPIYSYQYNILNLATGIYFIRLEIGNEIISKKFIKE